jgi:hypothetical protein
MPADVQARFNNVPLRCLSVSEALGLIYEGHSKLAPPAERSDSFATVSERDDFLIPTNFKRLQKQFDESSERALSAPTLPALAMVPGKSYPGSPVLGDARALSSFMLQAQPFKAGDRERTGWILFGGESLRDGGTLELSIQIVNGSPLLLRLALPSG